MVKPSPTDVMNGKACCSCAGVWTCAAVSRPLLLGLLLIVFAVGPLEAQQHIQKIATFSANWVEGMQSIHTDLDIMVKTFDAHRDAELIKQITKVQKELEKVILKPDSRTNIIANRVLKALNMHLYWLSQQIYVKNNRYAKTVLKSSHVQIQEMLKDVKSATAKMIDLTLQDADRLTAREIEARKNEVDSSIQSAQSAIDEAMRETQELIRAAELEDQARAAAAASAAPPLLVPKIVPLPSRNPPAATAPEPISATGTISAAGTGAPATAAAALPPVTAASEPASLTPPLAAAVSPIVPPVPGVPAAGNPSSGDAASEGDPGTGNKLQNQPTVGGALPGQSLQNQLFGAGRDGPSANAGGANDTGGPGFAGNLPVWTPPPEPVFPATGPKIISLSPAPGLQPFELPPAQPPVPDSPEGFDTPPAASEATGLPDVTGLATGSL